ncbi:MAG TPA: MarR family transcriptional regulator [Rhodanobacteraceae bacterium]|nr:MarR family transcriptional regulator [Rhodanobacteraceae bacterium]
MGTKANPAPSKQHRGVREAPARYAVHTNEPRSLADALFTTTQQRVLGALYGNPQRSFTVSELIASTGAGSGAVQRELAKLVASGLLTMQPIGNQKHYRANPVAPIHAELVGIVQKTVGLAEPLRAVLQPLQRKIAAAFVFGSVAKRSDTARSDIDLLIVSEKLGFADVLLALEPVQEKLGREINPIIFSRAELAKRIKSDNAFVKRVLEQPKIWLVGGEDDLRA